MTGKELMEHLLEALERREEIQRVQDFETAGVWCNGRGGGHGLVVVEECGAQFLVAIYQTRFAPLHADRREDSIARTARVLQTEHRA